MKTNYGKKIALSVALVLAIPTLSVAEGFYTSAQLGISIPDSNSEPYGNNIAVDSTFPGEYDSDNAFVGGIGFGYRFNKNFRVEGRIGYRANDINDAKDGLGGEREGMTYVLNGEVKTTSFTAEAFYDFANATALTPYVKAGVGIAYNKYSAKLGGSGVAPFDPYDGTTDGYYDNYADGDSTEFSWNIGVGTSYAINENISIYAEYQYSSFGDVKTGQDSFTDGFKIDGINAHELMLGIRYSF